MCKDNNQKEIIKIMKDYINTYDEQGFFTVDVFIKDILYGIGISINVSKYGFANGFRLFKRELVEKLTKEDY